MRETRVKIASRVLHPSCIDRATDRFAILPQLQLHLQFPRVYKSFGYINHTPLLLTAVYSPLPFSLFTQFILFRRLSSSIIRAVAPRARTKHRAR